MKLSRYESELLHLPVTYSEATGADVTRIKLAIAGSSDSSVIAVGSGGSFTVASLVCSLHEQYTGRVSRPSTPIEIICNPRLASASPVFLISAEGKNPDIVAALQRARTNSARPLHVITNRNSSPLTEAVAKLGGVTTHVFELAEKDGYLATNSLLMDAILVARAYGELDGQAQSVPPRIDGLSLRHEAVTAWIKSSGEFCTAVLRRGTLIGLFSPLLRPVAADLESKLSESALLRCQIADVRSFAHGRHLWLAERASEVGILAIVEPSVVAAWNVMRELIPPQIPVLTMELAGSQPSDLIGGIVAQMHLVAQIARAAGVDPGHPDVPEFGRSLHYLDLNPLIPPPVQLVGAAERSKSEVLGARWPAVRYSGAVVRAAAEYRTALEQQAFRAIVLDYDGTLCGPDTRDLPPDASIVNHILRLMESGVCVGVATGRGGSVQDALKASFPEPSWNKIQLGLYNCGLIGTIATDFAASKEVSEFLNHVKRIMVRLKALGAPIEVIRVTQPYQVSVRFRDGIQAEPNWFVIADALRRAGLDPSAIVRSRHSVDVLAKGVSKSHLVAHMIQDFKIEPYQVLTIGDQGAWPGNDAALLEHRFSLSVDEPSRNLDRGWKLAPIEKRGVDATLWYLENIVLSERGIFSISIASQDDRP